MVSETNILSLRVKISPNDNSHHLYTLLCTFNEGRSSEDRNVWDIAFLNDENCDNKITLVDLVSVIDQIFNLSSINPNILIIKVSDSFDEFIIRKSNGEDFKTRNIEYIQTLMTKFAIDF